MPTYEVQGPDGRVFEIEGAKPPTEADLDQIFSSFPQKKTPTKPSMSDQLTRQAGLTGRALVEGVLGIPAILAEVPRQAFNLIPGVDFPPQQQAVSDLLTSLGVPVPETTLERVVQSGAQALTGAGGMAKVASGMTGPIAANLAAQPAQQVAGGIGSGIAGQAAQEAGIGPAGQFAAALAGGIAGARVPRTGDSSAVKAAISAAEKAKIKVLTSDTRPPNSFSAKWVQSVGEKIPLAGTGGVRAKQQAQRADAVRNLLRQYGADDAAPFSDKVMIDLAGKRSGQISKYSNIKNEVFAKVDDIGTVPVPGASREIDSQISKLESLNDPSTYGPVIARLKDFKTAIQNQGTVNIEILRKDLGDSFKSPDAASVRTTAEKTTGPIYNALRQDIGNFIKENGAPRDFQKWKVANARLSNLIGEAKKGTLKAVLRSGEDRPEDVRRLLFSQKPSEIRLLYKNLTPKGRQNAKVAILQEIAEKSTSKGEISPDRFSAQVDKFGKSVGVFFSGKDLEQIRGLVKAINLTQRASQANLNPPTGVQVALPVGAAVLTDILGGYGAGLATGASLGGLARLYESPAVRNILLRLPKATGKEEAALMKRLISALQTEQQK